MQQSGGTVPAHETFCVSVVFVVLYMVLPTASCMLLCLERFYWCVYAALHSVTFDFVRLVVVP